MRNRQLEIGIALVLAFVVCACGASARQKTIRVTWESWNALYEQLPVFTKTHAKLIADAAKARGATEAETLREVDAFLTKTDHADLTLKACGRMIIAAAVLNDERAFTAMLAVWKLLKDEANELGLLKGALP